MEKNSNLKKGWKSKLISGIIVAIVVSTMLWAKDTFHFGKNKYDSEGFKHGKWTEYVNGDGTKEVSKKEAKYIREVEYNHGIPVGISKGYYPNGKLQSEFQLISKPYGKDLKRPKDKVKGLVKWFDEDYKIKDWMYYDDNGDKNYTKYIFREMEDISLDNRFDMNTFQNKYLSDRELKITLIKSILENEDDIKKLEELSSDDFGYQHQEDTENNAQNNTKVCHYCKGTGRCSECSQIFEIRYFDHYGGWKSRNETRLGYIRCNICYGAGYLEGGEDIHGNPRPKKNCYGACMNGWQFCPECNSGGNGRNIGVCKHCKGTGIET